MRMPVTYSAAPTRYDTMTYRRTGRSGLKLPAISLGLWHNFGGDFPFENMRDMCRTAAIASDSGPTMNPGVSHTKTTGRSNASHS